MVVDHAYAYVRHSLMGFVDTTRWQNSHSGRLKCNIDVAFSLVWNRTSIGICVHDDHGAYVLAKTLSILHMTIVDVGETLGLFHHLQSNGYKI